jgi:tetratricopeptide (TPR) repeat protein
VRSIAPCLLVVISALVGCGSRTPAIRTEPPPPETGESLYRRGHALFAEGNSDSALVILKESLALDSTHVPSLEDLSRIHYHRAMAEPQREHPSRKKDLERAFHYAMTMERLGRHDEAHYDLLTELADLLGEDTRFLQYARKNAELHPGDRQSYVLGLACARTGDHAGVIATQKEAVRKYPISPFVGGFYRLLGEAYFDIDRQQTAERTFTEGVKVVDDLLREIRNNQASADSSTKTRLSENRIAMLQSLRKIYRLHREDAKLREIDHLLNAGH